MELKMETGWATASFPSIIFPFLEVIHKSLRSSFLSTTRHDYAPTAGACPAGHAPGRFRVHVRPARAEFFALQGAPINSENSASRLMRPRAFRWNQAVQIRIATLDVAL